MGRRRYSKRTSRTISKVEWVVVIGIILYALSKKLLQAIHQLVLNIQYKIQSLTIMDWLLILAIIVMLILIINVLSNLKNTKLKKEQEEIKERRAAETRMRVLKDSEYQKLISMRPYDFEKYVADLFTLMGYEAELTPYSGDGGKDIILKKDNEISLVECKRYNENNKVSRPEIQKFHSAIVDMNAVEGFFVTTGYFTQPAMNYSINKPIKLINLPRLIELIEESKRNK
ncbi:restriction endonuclease [Peribacillus saganii]|uniref:Restriction endonuclease n=1 Tax=Peribacillus saganii TaxID=2303992 RepID=A0A372LTB0_9BACI|nr:restriction endonuclease [Peribacillus saganii]RFU71451.1 restriction endonuclease [Peribacillus saganii]